MPTEKEILAYNPNNSKEGFSCLVFGLLLGDLWLWEGALSAQMKRIC